MPIAIIKQLDFGRKKITSVHLKSENNFTIKLAKRATIGHAWRTGNCTSLPNSVTHIYISVAQKIREIFKFSAHPNGHPPYKLVLTASLLSGNRNVMSCHFINWQNIVVLIHRANVS